MKKQSMAQNKSQQQHLNQQIFLFLLQQINTLKIQIRRNRKIQHQQFKLAMGICYLKRSIEDIIYSKYTLAKQNKSKFKTHSYIHFYLWKYTCDDLALKQVKFYDANQTMDKIPISNESQHQYEDFQGSSTFLESQNLQWPFKVYADQAYIVFSIKNNKQRLQNIVNSISQKDKVQKNENPQNIDQHDDNNNLYKQKVCRQILQILYSVYLDSFKSYYYTDVKQQDNNPQFQASIEIITGDLLGRIQCIKLISICYEFQKYLRRGGQNILKKYYNQYETVAFFQETPFVNLNQSQKNLLLDPQQTQNQTIVMAQFSIEEVLQNEVKTIWESENYTTEQEKLTSIKALFCDFYKKLSSFNIFNTTLLASSKVKEISSSIQNLGITKQTKITDLKHFIPHQITQSIVEKQQTLAIQSEKIFLFQNIQKNDQISYSHKNEAKLFDSNEQEKNSQISIIQGPSLKDKKTPKGQELETSSPFICQITQIANRRQQFQNGDTPQNSRQICSKNGQKIIKLNGNIDNSLFLSKQLEELKIDRNMYKLNLPKQLELPQCNLILTTYGGSSQFQQLQKNNVSLVINMSPTECYNYFIHDITYEWYYLEPLHTSNSDINFLPHDLSGIRPEFQYLYNIECIIFTIVNRINSFNEASKLQNNQQANNAAIFCSHKNYIYSGMICVAYLMFTNQFRMSFQQALRVVNQSTNSKFQLPKVYKKQLIDLQLRINEASSPQNLNALNSKSSTYQGYEIGLYSKRDSTLIANRYIGELASSNQVQILEYNNLKVYLLIPKNLTSAIIKALNILREQNSPLTPNANQKVSNISKLLKNLGLSLKVLFGKDISNEQKSFYSSYIKQFTLVQLTKHEYFNFPKNIFNVRKYSNKLQIILESLKELIQFQLIEKSFRKPQPFIQNTLSLVKDVELLKLLPSSNKKRRIQPYNSKQTLTFKYPILRPIFESKKKDNYYFTLKIFQDKNQTKGNGLGCNVTFFKGQNWIGLEQDKQRYFEKIVEQYLSDVNEERIWIDDDQSGADKSLFDGANIIF